MQNFLISDTAKAAIYKHFDNSEAPFYVYDKEKIQSTCKSFLQIPYPLKKIHFATMANIHPTFLSIIRNEGVKVFVNSLPHLKQAQQIGYSGKDIIFTASAMNGEAMKTVFEAGAMINLDSMEQIELWDKVSGGSGYGIRCNIGNLIKPRKTRAGYFLGKASRLGLNVNEMKALRGNHKVKGLHLYVGTDIMEIEYFMDCYAKLGEFAKLYPGLEYMDLGGGFGIEDIDLTCDFDFVTYGNLVSKYMEELSTRLGRPLTLILEPGRILGGKAGYFACKVVDVKWRQKSQLIGVNACVSQFPRPLFYPDTAYHPLTILKGDGITNTNSAVTTENDGILSSIHGCSTYSRDYLAKNVQIGRVSLGDIIVFGHAGSYCASSYTEFLGFQKPEEIFL